MNGHLVYTLAELAGMPVRILDVYFRYIDSLQIMYQIGETIGEPHQDICSTP